VRFAARKHLCLAFGWMRGAAHGAEPSSSINAVIQNWEQGKSAIGRGVVDFSFDEAVRWSRTDLDFLFCDMEHRPPARIFHTVPSRGAGEGRGYEARAAQRAEAYLDSMLSTVSKRNDVDMALSCAAVGSV